MYDWFVSLKGNFLFFKFATFLVISSGAMMAYPANRPKTVIMVILLALLTLSAVSFHYAKGEHFLFNAHELFGYLFLIPALLIASLVSIFAFSSAINELSRLLSETLTGLKFIRCLPVIALLFLILPPYEIGPPNTAQFKSAIEQGEISAVRRWTRKFPELVNQSPGNNIFPLAHAVKHGQPEVVRLLLKNGAHINGPENWDGQQLRKNPLLEAVQEDNLMMAELLIGQGALLREQHILHTKQGGQETAFLELFATKPRLNASLAVSLLMRAAEANLQLVFDTILKRGYPIDVRDDNGNTALIKLATGDNHDLNYLQAVEILCSHGADINARGGHGRTALHGVIHEMVADDPLAIVHKLVAMGADPLAVTEGGQNAFHLLAANKQRIEKSVEMLDDLIALGVDINAKDHHGRTPIQILTGACFPNFFDPSLDEAQLAIVRRWFKSGADPMILNAGQGNAVLTGFQEGIYDDIPFDSSNTKPYILRVIRFASIFDQPKALLTQKDEQGMNALDVLLSRIFYSARAKAIRSSVEQKIKINNLEYALGIIVDQLFRNENSFAALYYRGAREIILGNFQRGLDLWQRAAALCKHQDPLPGHSYNDAALVSAHDRIAGARDEKLVNFYDLVMRFYSDPDHILNLKGVFFLDLGRYDQALACFASIIENSPDYGYAWYNKACTYAAMKKKQNMLRELSKAIELIHDQKALARSDASFKTYWDDEDFIRLTSE